MSYKVSTLLLKGCKTKEERDTEKEYISHNKRLLDRIANIMSDKLDSSVGKMRGECSYDKPSWPQFQADQLGYQRALAEMLAIISLTGDDNDR